jgi:hypothetical protein
MITKEELLQKGIDPAEADVIMAALENQNNENSSPLALLKAEMDGGSEMDTLFKAKGEMEGDTDNEDGDDDYDEAYMKRYMKKYMKANKKDAANAAKEVGLFAGEMKKAAENFPEDAEGAVVEMGELSDFFEKQIDFSEKMVKAIEAVVERIDVIEKQNLDNYSLLYKASAVTAETAEIISEIGNTPQGRKGVVVADMEKAAKSVSGVDTKTVYSVLMKAITSGDKTAGDIGAKFESAGKNFNALNSGEQNYVKELINKEAN